MNALRVALNIFFLCAFFLLQNLSGCASTREKTLIASRQLLQKVSAFLAGGREAPRGRYSYVVSLRTPRQRLHGCGGVLIDPTWILTAAHCVDPNVDFSVGPNPIVYIGVHKINDLSDGGEALATISTHIHPNYTGNVKDGSDIALLRLEKPCEYQIPRLPSPNTALKDGETFITLGWGRTSKNGPLPTALQEASGLIFVPNMNCNFPQVWNGLIKDDMICAGGIGGDSCKGDSGGPLIIADEPGGEVINGTARFDVLMGITSFGPDDCLTFGQPGVYTSVVAHLDWIYYIFANPNTTTRDFSSIVSHSEGPVLQLDGSNGKNPVARSIQVVDDNQCEYECELKQKKRRNGAILYECQEVTGCSAESDSDLFPIKNPDWPRLFEAAGTGDLKAVKRLLSGTRDVNEMWKGQTALHIAAQNGHAYVVQALLKAGARANMVTGEEHDSTLHKAIIGGDSRIVVMLIRSGANVNGQNTDGKMPIHLAAAAGKTNLMEILVAARSQLDVGDANGQTPLHLAAKAGFINVIELLTIEGAEEKQDANGNTPLDIACTCVDRECSRTCVNEPRRVKETLNSSR